MAQRQRVSAPARSAPSRASKSSRRKRKPLLERVRTSLAAIAAALLVAAEVTGAILGHLTLPAPLFSPLFWISAAVLIIPFLASALTLFATVLLLVGRWRTGQWRTPPEQDEQKKPGRRQQVTGWGKWALDTYELVRTLLEWLWNAFWGFLPVITLLAALTVSAIVETPRVPLQQAALQLVQDCQGPLTTINQHGESTKDAAQGYSSNSTEFAADMAQRAQQLQQDAADARAAASRLAATTLPSAVSKYQGLLNNCISALQDAAACMTPDHPLSPPEEAIIPCYTSPSNTSTLDPYYLEHGMVSFLTNANQQVIPPVQVAATLNIALDNFANSRLFTQLTCEGQELAGDLVSLNPPPNQDSCPSSQAARAI